MTASREYHLIIDRDGLVRADTYPQGFDACVKDIRDGEHRDVATVLFVKVPNPKWPGEKCIEDVTLKVACALAAQSHDHPLTPGSAAYRLVEEQLSCADAHRARERAA